MAEARDIVWHAGEVRGEERGKISRVRPAILWLTGLSGCGKSTVAMALEKELVGRGHLAFVLDGDNVRHGLNKNLGFSDADRTENIRRIGEVAKLFLMAGVMPIASFISPFRVDRESVRGLVGEGEFVEIFVDAPLEVCEGRDPKGLYKKARTAAEAGKGMQFTGVDSVYERPVGAEIHLRTEVMGVGECVEVVMKYLKEHGRLLA